MGNKIYKVGNVSNNSIVVQGEDISINRNEQHENTKKGFDEILVDLKNVIETDLNIKEYDKKESLAKLKELEELNKRTNDEESVNKARGIIRWFKGLIQEIPNTIELADRFNKYLPQIQKLFGL